jgi:adenine-specific DNA-methyltransferase
MIDLLKRYDTELFLDIVKQLIPDFQKDEQLVADHSDSFLDVQRLGASAEFAAEVFCIKISGSANRRIGITTDSFKLLKRYACRRAIIAYWSESEFQWRISLLSATHKIKDGKITTEFSNPRRHSYLVGPETKVATPTLNLVSKGMCDSFEDLEQRFALEVVNKEFYTQIADLFTKLVGGERKSGSTLRNFTPLIQMPKGASSADRHEFGVRLLGRIIFCWFLKQKKGSWGIPLLPDPVIPIDLSGKTNIYKEVFEPLFFEVLNRPKESRQNVYRTENLDLVPFLNGGLFEPLSGNSGDYFEKDSLLSIPDTWFQELFNVLNIYSFTIDENTSFDVELSVDPEMLGRIFENLLAEISPETGESARKATGSFYTPRTIVEYMVDRTLSLYLQKTTSIEAIKIDALVSYDKTDDLVYPLSEEERIQVVRAINKFTALDPACGSGAFPIGLLQKLVYVLQEVDPNCAKWMDEQCAILPKEVRKQVRNSLEVKGIDYVRKLGVIRQCIYGVDIQPIATEISRLRCFLTLIVDEKVDDFRDNRGIEPLPNLDFKFVTANSLLTLDELEKNKTQDSLFGDISHIEKLRGLRESFFTSSNEEKVDIRRSFKLVQENMRVDISNKKSAATSKYEKLATWEPFSLDSTPWFDPFWMFGINEFDMVIGNPPYISALAAKKIFPAELRERYKALYESASGAYDMYLLFMELGIKLLSANGHLVFITPTKFLSAKYAESFRRIASNSLVEISDFNNVKVFDSASVSTLVSIFGNSAFERKHTIVSKVYELGNTQPVEEKIFPKESLFEFPEQTWGHLKWGHYGLISRVYANSCALETAFEVVASSTAAEADQWALHISDKSSTKSFKMVNTGTIRKFVTLWGVSAYSNKKSKLLEPYLDAKTINSRRVRMFESPKLIIAKLSKQLTASYDANGDFASSNSVFVIDSDSPYSIAVLSGLMNSALLNYVYRTSFSGLNLLGSFQFQAPQIRVLPVPKTIDSKLALQIESCVNRIQSERSDSALVKSVISEIDELVFAAYGLAPGDIEKIKDSV